MPQPVSKQVIALGSISKRKTRRTRVTTVVAYVYPQKAKPEPITGITNFEIMIGINKVWAGVSSREG